MTDPLSVHPQDEELLAEIGLLSDLMIAANDADGRVDRDIIDFILRRPPLISVPVSTSLVPLQRTALPERTRDAQGKRARAVAREIAIQRRAIGISQTAVARFTHLGQYERAEVVRRRLKHAHTLLQLALQQREGLLHQDYAAMGDGRGPNAFGHAVAEGSRLSVCGLAVSAMMGVAEDFSLLPAERQCPACGVAITNGAER